MLISSTAPIWSRTVPMKVTMAPMSVRPCSEPRDLGADVEVLVLDADHISLR